MHIDKAGMSMIGYNAQLIQNTHCALLVSIIVIVFYFVLIELQLLDLDGIHSVDLFSAFLPQFLLKSHVAHVSLVPTTYLSPRYPLQWVPCIRISTPQSLLQTD